MQELIEEVDPEGNVLAIHPKEKLKERMFLHRCVLVIPRGQNGTFVFSRRAKEKWPFPDTWVCAIGGKVQVGETVEAAAIRETQEEAGVTLPLQRVGLLIYDKADYKGMFFLFTTKDVVDLRLLQVEPSEVQYFQAFHLAQLQQMIAKEPETFAPTFLAVMELFFCQVTS